MSEAIHRVVFNADGTVDFFCDGGPESPCHIYPSCKCQVWDETCRELGHLDVIHDECWKLTWLEAGDPLDTHLHEEGDGYGRDGEILTDFDADYLTWHYAIHEPELTHA